MPRAECGGPYASIPSSDGKSCSCGDASGSSPRPSRLMLGLLRTSEFRLTGPRLPDGCAKLRILRAVDLARDYLRCTRSCGSSVSRPVSSNTEHGLQPQRPRLSVAGRKCPHCSRRIRFIRTERRMTHSPHTPNSDSPDRHGRDVPLSGINVCVGRLEQRIDAFAARRRENESVPV